MKVALCVWLIVATARSELQEAYTKNNPLNLKQGKVFYSSFGQKFDLYSTDKEIRNILVPASEHLHTFDFYNPDARKHPPIFFNLFKNGQNDGVYVLKNQTATKIKDGSDTVADYLDESSDTHDAVIYIAASDGIYKYNPVDEAMTKFGSITENFKAIDKVSHKDELYVLAADNKIYKITTLGTVKTKVEGIDFAKDFVLDLQGAIYFIGEDNKPQVLYKGSTTPVKVTGLNFDVKKPLLGRPLWNPDNLSGEEHTVPFITDGVSYALVNSSALAVPADAVVPGLTAFSAEYSFIQVYGENGHIYMHALLVENPNVLKTRSSIKFRIMAFDRDVAADCKAFKGRKRKQQKKH